MNVHGDKTQQYKGPSAAVAVHPPVNRDSAASQFVNHRPAAFAQSALQEMASVSPQVKQSGVAQHMAKNGLKAKQAESLLAMESLSLSRQQHSIQNLLGVHAPAQAEGMSRSATQRKANLLMTAEAVKEEASANLLSSDNYDRILDEVAAYYSSSQTPNDSFGMQLRRLSMIRDAIQLWVVENGPLNQAVQKGLFGYSGTDKRRMALNRLQISLGNEETAVQLQGQQSADQNHLQDRTALVHHIEDGKKSTDLRLRNTCEWILATGKTTIYPVTTTGDAYERLFRANISRSTGNAFFPSGFAGGAGDIKNAAVSYDPTNLGVQPNVTLRPDGANTGGWQTDGNVAITNVRQKDPGSVLEVLTHEVQHDADKHYGRDNRRPYRSAGKALDDTGSKFNQNGISHPDLPLLNGKLDWEKLGFQVDVKGEPVANSPSNHQLTLVLGPKISKAKQEMKDAKEMYAASIAESALERYKTEYRAYSYQESSDNGTYAKLENKVQDKAHGGQLFTQRQLAIFKHIYANYGHTKDGWDDNPILADKVTRFRGAVAHYWNPDSEGFNKLNSIRIDDVYYALDAIGAKAPATQIETRQGIDAAPVDDGKKVSDSSDPGVLLLLERIGRLVLRERTYILNESSVWPDKLAGHLSGGALGAVNAAVYAPIRLNEDATTARMTNFWGR